MPGWDFSQPAGCPFLTPDAASAIGSAGGGAKRVREVYPTQGGYNEGAKWKTSHQESGDRHMLTDRRG